MNRIRAKKHLGQHFLVDEHTASRIVNAVAPHAEDTIIEIGPGLGALTAPLLQTQCRVEAVEIDRELIERLRRRFAQCASLRLYHEDALRFDFSAPAADGSKARIVGNLPYNISTPLLMRLFDASEQIRDMHLMLQTEIAERMTAQPGSRNYSRLSVATHCFVKAQHLFDVAPEAFSPVPRVNSSVVRLLPRPFILDKSEREAFFSLVSKAFSQRRKTIGRIFSGTFSHDDFAQMHLRTDTRPQQLEVKHFLVMLDLLRHKSNDNGEVK